MQGVADHLRATVARAVPILMTATEAQASARPAPGKWCAKEVVGHLIDSALINHQRLMRALATDDLVAAGYEQDRWVDAQRYAEAPWSDLVQLWSALNGHLARAIVGLPREACERPRTRHSLQEIAWQTVPADQPVTLGLFVRDYLGHLEHHLRQARAALAAAAAR